MPSVARLPHREWLCCRESSRAFHRLSAAYPQARLAKSPNAVSDLLRTNPQGCWLSRRPDQTRCGRPGSDWRDCGAGRR
jgi:hypothetical protein